MRSFFLLAILLAGCRAEQAVVDQPRASEQSFCAERDFEDDHFFVCDAKGGDIRLIAAGPDETAIRDFARLAGIIDAESVAFAMNAGMFDEDGRPIGLAIVEGKEVHAINKRKGGGNFHLLPNGVFLVRESGRAEIVDSDAFKPAGDIRYATQSGPMLVIGGKLHPKFEPDGVSRHIRNGVGVRDGKAIFVITRSPVSFGKLARFFRDELKTPNALYFDGSVSSLWDPGNNRQDSHSPLGPMVVAMHPR